MPDQRQIGEQNREAENDLEAARKAIEERREREQQEALEREQEEAEKLNEEVVI